MTEQRPDGPKDLTCPLHRRSMAKVCRSCPLWTHIRGADPNSGDPVDRWGCALAFLPMLTIENSMMQRQTGAAVESFRNVVAEAAATAAQTLGAALASRAIGSRTPGGG